MKKVIVLSFALAIIFSTFFVKTSFSQVEPPIVPSLKYLPYNFPASLIPSQDFQVLRKFTATDSYKTVLKNNIQETIKRYDDDDFRPSPDYHYLPNITTNELNFEMTDEGTDLFMTNSIYKGVSGSMSEKLSSTLLHYNDSELDEGHEVVRLRNGPPISFSINKKFIKGRVIETKATPEGCDEGSAYVIAWGDFSCNTLSYLESGFPSFVGGSIGTPLENFVTPHHDIKGNFSFSYERKDYDGESPYKQEDRVEYPPLRDKAHYVITVSRNYTSSDSLILPPATKEITYVVEASVVGYKSTSNTFLRQGTGPNPDKFGDDIQLVDLKGTNPCKGITINGVETLHYKNFLKEESNGNYVVANNGSALYKYPSSSLNLGRCYAYFNAKSGSETDITPEFSVSTDNGLITYDLRVKVGKPKEVDKPIEEEKCKVVFKGSSKEKKRRIIFMYGGSTSSSFFKKETAINFVMEIMDTGFKRTSPFKENEYLQRFNIYLDMIPHILPKGADFIDGTTSNCPGDSNTIYVFMNGELGRSYGSFLDRSVMLHLPGISGKVGQHSVLFANTAIHELGHVLGDLEDEYEEDKGLLNKIGFALGSFTQCSTKPRRDYTANTLTDHRLYGEINEKGCSYLKSNPVSGSEYYRPSSNSIMRNHNIDNSTGKKFNVISCGYLVAAIKGEPTKKEFAQKYWAECLKMDTIDVATVPAANPNPTPKAKLSIKDSIIGLFSLGNSSATAGQTMSIEASNLTPEDNAIQLINSKTNKEIYIDELTSSNGKVTFKLPSDIEPGAYNLKVAAFNSLWSDAQKITISKLGPTISPTPLALTSTKVATTTATTTKPISPKKTDSILTVPLLKTTTTSDINPAQYIPSIINVENGSKFSVNVRLLVKTQKATISAQCPTNTSLTQQVAYKQSSTLENTLLCGTSVEISPIPSQALIFTSQNLTPTTQNVILTLTQTDAEGQSTKSTSRISIKSGQKASPTVTPTVSPTQSATPSVTPKTSPTATPTISPTKTPLTTVTATPTSTPTPSATYTTSPSPTQTVTPTVTATPTASVTTSPTPITTTAPITSSTATPTPTPTVAPATVSLTASPSSITSGSGTTLYWSTSGATSCTSNWGAVGTNGSATLYPSSTFTYTISCNSISKSVTVSVFAPTTTASPSASSTASPSVSPSSSSSGTPSSSASADVYRASLWDAVKALFGF